MGINMNEEWQKLNLGLRQGRHMPGDWLWPNDDVTCWRFFTKKQAHIFNGIEYWSANFPNMIVDFFKNMKNDVVIQAGGNAGLYPKLYSKVFKEVYTFEPDPRWFYCLDHNIKEDNIKKYHAALGSNNNPVRMEYNLEIPNGKQNLGAKRVEVGGTIQQIKIDDLNISPDLIHLDIEGFEGEAILGSIETIRKCHPVIVLETNDSGKKYGWPLEKIEKILFDEGYKIVKDWHHDRAYAI